MNRSEQEQLRHDLFVQTLENATLIEELPKKIQPSLVLTAFVNAVSFTDKKIDKEKLQLLLNNLLSDTQYLVSEEFSLELEKILKESYVNKTEEEIKNKVNESIKNKRLFNLISESISYDIKYSELLYKEITEKHETTLRRINTIRTVEDLPKVGLSNINRQIQKDLYELFNKEQLRVEFTGKITKTLLEGKSINDEVIQNAIKNICESRTMIEPYNSMSIDKKIEYVSDVLSNDYELGYLVEEVVAREKRIIKIYKLDHEDIMDQIKDSNRISQMPPNLSISRITSYLSGNSMIYSKGIVIQSGEFIKIAELLLNGKKMQDNEVQEELKNIVNKFYEENQEEAFNLLNTKLSELPRLYYYVEEVKYGQERQKEFISRGSSNVNVYFIPNSKSPIEGGRFYNCYINRASNLNLEEILPLDLNEIVPPEMDIDSIEWYVQQNADPTFKTAGGIILNKDESIGGVNIFRPADGKVGITPEEKSRYQQLESLNKKLKEISDISKKSKEEFMKSQQEYLKSQSIIDEQIATIQDAISILIDDKEKGLK